MSNTFFLKNINQLRDRFEGQAYMDKIMLKLTGLFVLEKHLNIGITELPIFLDDSNELSIVRFNNKKYRIISF